MKNERLNGGSGGKTFVVDGTLLKSYNGNDESLRLPGFIFGVGNKAFAGNESVKKVSLSSNVIAVGEYAFDGCSSLEEIDLPYELKAIGKLAFNGCVKLKSILFNGTKERWFSVKKGEDWLKDTPDFIISCKDGDITKQEEIEFESEPTINFDFEIKEGRLNKSAHITNINDGEKMQDEDGSEQCVIRDMSDWSPENREAYLERRRNELIKRMQSAMAEDEDESEDVENDESWEEPDDIRYKVLKLCIEKGYASVSLIQRRFPIGYMQSCNTIDWMVEKGYIISKGKNADYEILITKEEFNSIVGIVKSETSKELPAFKKLLEKLTLNKKDSVKRLATVLNRIAEKKRNGDIAIEEPSHSLWNDEAEFDAAVMERLERLVRSDLKMARRSAIKKAETYLYAVHDTRDGQMIQVYERVVYELKITSDRLYNQIRNCIRNE